VTLGGVTDRYDLNAKLVSATDWVRGEFAYISDAAAGLGCNSRLESGPGHSFRIDDRMIVRVHPKRRHIALGLPDRLRPDVHALTQALRDQRGEAWFNYAPGVCDRDTIEVLVDKSMHAVTAGSGEPAPTAPSLPAGPVEPTRDDHADLALILAVLRAFRQHQDSTGLPSPVKALRETIFFQWEGPRLPPGGKYSSRIPHSPAAREQRATGHRGHLIYEHVTPIATVIRKLLDNLPADEDALRAALDEVSDRVIITKAEERAERSRRRNGGTRSTGPVEPVPNDRNQPIRLHSAEGLASSGYRPAAQPASITRRRSVRLWQRRGAPRGRPVEVIGIEFTSSAWVRMAVWRAGLWSR
jgi:hypothetical protein